MIILSDIIDTGIPVLTGFMMSVVHVFSGPDHLAAVTPLAINSKMKSWSVGLSWGVGHTIGMLIIGLIFVFFKERLNIEVISSFGEKLVGFMLIVIGIWVLIKLRLIKSKNEEKLISNRQNIFSAGSIGVIHGIAGFSHIIFLLPVLGFESGFGSAMYLFGFASGTLLSMIIYSFVLGLVTKKTDELRAASLSLGIRYLGAFFSIGIGVFWIFQTIND